MQSISVFLDIETSELYQIHQTILRRTQEICLVIKTFFRSSLGEVQPDVNAFVKRTDYNAKTSDI